MGEGEMGAGRSVLVGVSGKVIEEAEVEPE
jgi:hypothetical protein